MCNNIRHQLDIPKGIEALQEDPHSLHHDEQRLSSGIPAEDHSTSTNVDHSSISLGLFNRIDEGSRMVGCQLLLQVPGVLEQRQGVGHVESHITSMTTQLRGPEHLDQQDPLPWEIWARPIGFM